jgi:type II secretory pathway predicted ATPase ExeA
MAKPLLEEVFKRSGVPTYTFVEPAEYNHLKVALRTPGRGLVVEGPSGIGKTTAVRRAAADIGLGDRAQMLSGRNADDREVIAELPKIKNLGIVVIDDFHRLDDATKHAIADYLKELADREDPTTKIVLIGINKAGDSLVSFAADLNNRIVLSPSR